ncbi:MAG: glutamate formimidoyltransferase [Flammeovirgaceae bacterium]
MKKLIECVPNFSEGQNREVIQTITAAIEAVHGVQLLEVDPGYAANRTVVTFIGEPQAVVEAAFQAMKTAQQVIDMSKQTGVHPRFGGTDVCPLVPIANISMEEVVQYAHQLAKRVGEELAYPVYCYEHAALVPARKNLAVVRSGEYEGLAEKLKVHPPDFGPATFHPRSGATAIGAREFLIAYNINLNTTDTKVANAIAFDIRESGRVKKENGMIIRDEQGKAERIPGLLKSVKAIGWYIEEYNKAQVSTNITDINTTPVHVAFEAAKKAAKARGVKVTGSELVGLLPLKVLLDAGRFYVQQDGMPVNFPEEFLVSTAVEALGLGDLKPFDVKKKVIEYMMD